MRFGYLPPVNECAVARKIVFDQAAPVFINDERVRPADRLVLKQDVASGTGAEPVIPGVNAVIMSIGIVAVCDQPAYDASFGLAQWRGFIAHHYRVTI